jgi:hypothetical protein
VRQVAAIAALAITFLVSACFDTGRSNPAAEVNRNEVALGRLGQAGGLRGTPPK